MRKWIQSTWTRLAPFRLRRAVERAGAHVWRRVLFRTTFIAITGSVGKTTAKECLGAILSSRYRTGKTKYNRNGGRGVARTILQVKRRHRFAVMEVGTERPGQLQTAGRLVRPRMAIVLSVARTHTDNFKTLEDTAAEKARILDFLPSCGTAILNAEDPRVRAMAEGRRCRVKMFGRSPGLDMWAEDVSSKWPARLTFRACTASESEWVTTNLVGEHWVNSVLGALLAAQCCGVPLKAAAAAVSNVKPFLARMQPVVLPNGATILRDEETGTPDTVDAALRVLKDASVGRRVLVISDVSDLKERTRVRLKRIGKMAADVADLAVFIGEHGHYAVKSALAAGMTAEWVQGFVSIEDAAEYLKTELRSGDLALLKGRACDHLERVVFAQFGTVGCWKVKCRKRTVCDLCKELRPEVGLGPGP